MSRHPSPSPLLLSQSFPVLGNHSSCCVIAKVRHTQTIWEWKNEKNERSSIFSPSPRKKSLQIGVSGSPNAHGCVHTHLALFTKRGPMVYFCGLTFLPASVYCEHLSMSEHEPASSFGWWVSFCARRGLLTQTPVNQRGVVSSV